MGICCVRNKAQGEGYLERVYSLFPILPYLGLWKTEKGEKDMVGLGASEQLGFQIYRENRRKVFQAS